MQIRELHIDGFGLFADKQVKGFTSGVNIIYGSNEFGKTTLLEFVRRTLFGFPRKKQGINLYPPVPGRAYGGKLLCQLANGEMITIARTQGAQGGDVTVSGNFHRLCGQKNLNTFLGHASQELYQNIFAFSLDELQFLGSLQGEEIKNHIYGAGLGLGSISLSSIEESLQERCDGLFKPKGKTQKMPLLLNDIKSLQREIRDIQGNLAQYDELQDVAHKLNDEKEKLERKLQELETQRRILDTRRDLYPVYVELDKAENELGGQVEIPDFPQHASETLAALKSELQSLQNLSVQENEERERLKLEKDNVGVNEELLRREGEVASLRSIAEQARSAISDKIEVGQQRDLLEDQIQVEIERISSGWGESTVVDFEITEAEKEQIPLYKEALEEVRQSLERAKDKLEMHRQQKAEEASRGLNVPEWLKVVSYSLLGLSAIGIVWGGFISSVPLLILSVMVLALGVVSARMIYKKKGTLVKEDQFEPLLAEKALRAEKEVDRKSAEWRAWLKERKLDDLLPPLATEKVLMIIQQAKGLLRQRADLDGRLKNMQEIVDKAARLISGISPCLKTQTVDLDVAAMTDIINQAYDQAVKNNEKGINLQVQMDGQEKKMGRLREQLSDKEKALRNFIRSAGAQDENDFHHKRLQLEKRKSLEKTVNEKRDLIQSKVGLGATYQRFLESLKTANPEEIQQALDAVSSQLEKFQETRDRLNQQVGEIRNRINQLVSDNDLLVKQSELEIKKEQLNRHSKEWATCKMALFMLERAKRRYEKERQPDVIRAAEKIFSKITGGKYKRIIKPLDDDDIHIDNDSGDRKGMVEMSRGTREQLYLAMRLGLIEEYETRAEPLPVIMDDVLVNFDDQRKLKVMEILRDFAESRQVIILSCHRYSLEAYKDLGATQITI